MVEGWIQKKHRRHIQDLNIVPILDMLTTVIFFLLMSTSFIEFTKTTIPPSATATVSTAEREPPKTPKMYLISSGGGKMKLLLRWSGKQPGDRAETIQANDDPKAFREALVKASEKLVREFSERNPEEKTLQIGLQSQLPYQSLISMMDGARALLPDLILISYGEADAVAQAVEVGGN
jgi:biopolymer transport protein ExbD